MSFQKSVPNSWGGQTYESSRLPPGFRFCPTDEELICYYLTKKILNSSAAFQAIGVVDFNKCEPWDLQTRAQTDDNAFYFFTLKDRKYPTGMRTNRATQAGYWKATGKDREVLTGSAGRLTGMKKTLVFYTGRAPKGLKTNWVMHEYRLDGESRPEQQEWVVCRVFEKSSSIKRTTAPELSSESEYSNVQPGSFLPAIERMESTSFHSVKPDYSFVDRTEKSPSIKKRALEPSINSAYSGEYSNVQSGSFLPGLQSMESTDFHSVKPNYSIAGRTQGYPQTATYPVHETNLRRSNSNLKLKKDLRLGDTLENLVAGWDIDISSPESLWYPSAAP